MLFCSLIRQPDEWAEDPDHGVELRLDLFPHLDFDFIRQFIQNSSSPVMLTMRGLPQEEQIEKLLALEPPFFDLESDMRPEFLKRVMSAYPKTKFILSSHDRFDLPSFDIDPEPFSYKIANTAQSTNEALKLLQFGKKHPNVSMICMGKQAEFARVLGKVMGNRVNYSCLNDEERAAPGQLTLAEMVDIYRYDTLNEQTAIYGLIGDPVEQSPGHLHHNAVFKNRCLNAVYVKMLVRPEELSEFIPLAKEIGIRGLSVTMPLKERIIPFIDEIDPSCQKIGAINTLRFEEGRIFGTNTDGHGALDAIEGEMAVYGKKVVLLGAGGAARAIAFEAKERGAEVLILNRTLQRAKELAKEFGCEAARLEDLPICYDVLINCSPEPLPIDPEKMCPETVAMDVVYSPKETLFLQEAAKRRCQIVYGQEMFLNQAKRQTAFWLKS
jgi:3-dehydroquinate dehydratase / shikimate dehydrogenase